jgi:hypothetical protein
MKRLLLTIFAALLVACATSPSAQIDFAYSTVNAYVDAAKQAKARGRINDAQALQAAENADKAIATIGKARTALAACKGQPCADFQVLMKSLPDLTTLERELREKEAKK